MTPSEITRIGEALFGKNWKSPLARKLGTSHKTVWMWSAGRHKPSRKFDEELRAMPADQAMGEAAAFQR